MINQNRKLFNEIKQLITHHEYKKIDEGIEMLSKSNNVLFYEKILHNCTIREGILIASEIFTVSAPRQPLIDYALWNIIGNCPKEANIDVSLSKNNIKSVKFRSYNANWYNTNYITKFPLGITEFANLKLLDCSNTKFSIIPNEISKLNKLIILDLSDNYIKIFQNDICNIISLKKLLISNNNITVIPNEIGNLVNLEILELHNNNINKLPKSIDKLKNLNIISLKNNKLKSLTNSINCLKNIKELNIDSNNLTALPKSINELNKLVKLSLSNNSLTKFPKIDLINLKELNLCANEITIIPNEINKLKSLEILLLSGNRNLGVFESGICLLDKLKTLEIGRTGKLKPKPKSLYLTTRREVESFFTIIKSYYKLEDTIKTDYIKLNGGNKNEIQYQEIEIKPNTKTSITDVNEDIISSLSNYINSDDIEIIDIGINLILNLNNKLIYKYILSKWELKSGFLKYIINNEGFEIDNSLHRNYFIYNILTSDEFELINHNKFNISDINYFEFRFIENRYPDFISKLKNIETLKLNCRGQILKDDIYKLNRLKSISLDQTNNLMDINFQNFKNLESINIENCNASEYINYSNQLNLIKLEIRHLKTNDIIIENNPRLENIILNNVSSNKLTIVNCPNLKIIEIKYCGTINDFIFQNIITLNEIIIRNTTIPKLMEFITNNINMQKVEIDKYKLLVLNESINKLKNLIDLKLTNSNIKAIPNSIGELYKLEAINLSNNELKNIPDTISNLKELKTIDLRYQSGTTKEFNSLNDIPLIIFKIKGLKNIWVSWPSLVYRKFIGKMSLANLYDRSGIISNN